MKVVRIVRCALASTVLASCLLTACTDDLVRPVAPSVETTGLTALPDGPRLLCSVSAAERTMSCARAPVDAIALPPGVRADRVVVGRQDVYMSLASAGSSYNAGTGVFEIDVTVQNLLQSDVGTTDGTTTTGVTVFLVSAPTTVQGTGTVTVLNADGIGHFTSPANQPYWLYNEILEPYQISAQRAWQFQVPNTVVQFQFLAYLSAPVVDSTAPLLDAVWTGATSTSWFVAGNWANAAVPNASSVVAIPSAALLGNSRFPQLSTDAAIASLRVGQGSSLTLDGHTISLAGNLDAIGPITGGTVRLTSATARLGGRVPALIIDGAARLQRTTTASGPVTITGSLGTNNLPLTVAIP